MIFVALLEWDVVYMQRSGSIVVASLVLLRVHYCITVLILIAK
jgi:hypothetical protein